MGRGVLVALLARLGAVASGTRTDMRPGVTGNSDRPLAKALLWRHRDAAEGLYLVRNRKHGERLTQRGQQAFPFRNGVRP